ncbi:hypothetical protein KSD_16360 [Ktedonobacter sp. SOSP1-85]|nr:hypothetical protein KSD_16360 [Ktedonobacter sp. SOSP1-85]
MARGICDQFPPGYLILLLESVLQNGTVFSGTQTVVSRLEMPSDGTEGSEKALRLFD